jgi:hypothetical protein
MFQNLNRAAAIALACALLTTVTFPAFSQHTSVAALSAGTSASEGPNTVNRTPPEAELVLNRFVASEAEVREALNQHTFKRDVVLQTIGPNGEVTGEYIRNSQFVFDNKGRRIERVLFHPKSTIRAMRITKEDIQDLAGAQLLGIDITETTKYRLNYVGMETVDLRQLIAIDVTPLVAPDPHRMKDRFFVGRVWLDPSTFQIVKVKGIVEPQGKQRFPLFETWREPVKGALAFPVRTEADDILHFKNSDVHYRIKVRYYDYQLFASRVTVKELDDTLPMSEADSKNSNDKNPPKLVPAPPPVDSTRTGITSAPMSNSAAVEACTANHTAPPIGAYHWPADTEVKVYFLRSLFTPEQRVALLEAMAEWTAASQEIGSGVQFADAGETDTRQTCKGCLTIRRADVFKEDKRHYAFFYPMNRVDRLLVSAWIDFDYGITKPSALKGFMAHELAHGLGLWDCLSCKKKRSIMSGFPGRNKDNGLVAPSRCDLATVRDVYQQERLVARSPLQPNSIASAESTSASSTQIAAQSNAVEEPLRSLFRLTVPKEKLALPLTNSRLADGPHLPPGFSSNSTAFLDLSSRRANAPSSRFPVARFF